MRQLLKFHILLSATVIASFVGCSAPQMSNQACLAGDPNCQSAMAQNDPLSPQAPNYSGYPVDASARQAPAVSALLEPITISGDDAFAAGKADLSASTMVQLDAIALRLKANPSAKYDVVGHSDSRGDAQANQQLSEKRAQAVANYLYSRGVRFGSLNVIGAGETQLLDQGSSDEAHSRNRRVEIRNSLILNRSSNPASEQNYSFSPAQNSSQQSATNPYSSSTSTSNAVNPYANYGSANTAQGYGNYTNNSQPQNFAPPSIPHGSI